MTRKDTAVTSFVVGLLTGMVVAFASCSSAQPGAYQQSPPAGQQLPVPPAAQPVG